MAQKVQIHLIDDLSGDDAQETVRFGLDGSNYEIDLTTDNAAKLREVLSIYTDKGRKAGRGTGRPRAAAASNRQEMHRIREWARDNGHNPSNRGRLSSEIIEAYHAAHH